MNEAPRKPCPACARKHLAQATVLLQESVQGYPEHRWLAVGHVAEAEAEIFGMFPDIADLLRQARHEVESSENAMPDLMGFIKAITDRVEGNWMSLMQPLRSRRDYGATGDERVSRAQMASTCPSCVERVAKQGIPRVRASVIRDAEAATGRRVLKSAMTWDECIADAKKKSDVRDPEKLCGWLKSHGPNASDNAVDSSIRAAMDDFRSIKRRKGAK